MDNTNAVSTSRMGTWIAMVLIGVVLIFLGLKISKNANKGNLPQKQQNEELQYTAKF